MKKWILGLSATAAVATPLIAVVSCGTHNKEEKKSTESTDKPEIVVDHAPTQTGVAIERPAKLPNGEVQTVATTEEVEKHAEVLQSVIDAFNKAFDDYKARRDAEDLAQEELDKQLEARHQAHQDALAEYNSQFIKSDKEDKIQNAEQVAKHLEHEALINKEIEAEESEAAERQAELDHQAKVEEHQKEVAAYELQLFNDADYLENQDIKSQLDHQAHVAQMEKEAEAERQEAEWFAEQQRQELEHQHELEAQELDTYNNYMDLRMQQLQEAARHQAHEAAIKAEEDAIAAASKVSSTAHNLVRSISKGALATPTQFRTLVTTLADLDDQIESFVPDFDEIKSLTSKIESITDEISKNQAPTLKTLVAPELSTLAAPARIYEVKAPEHNAQYKLGMTFHAGNFVKEFKDILLSKYTAAQLTQASSGKTMGFFAVNKLDEIQKFIRQTLLDFFPLLKNEINALPADVLYYAERGDDYYGIRFNLLNYLLNTDNGNKSTFSEFVRADWDQMGSHHSGAKFEGYLIGQSNLGKWDIEKSYYPNGQDDNGAAYDAFVESKVTNFLKALDTQVAVNPDPMSNSQSTFNDAVETFKTTTTGNMFSNTVANDWVKTAKGTVFIGINGVQFYLNSAVVDQNDPSKVICEFTAVASWATPIKITRVLEGFKTVSPRSFDGIWGKIIAIVGEVKTIYTNSSSYINNVKSLLSSTYPELANTINSLPNTVFGGAAGGGLISVFAKSHDVKSFIEMLSSSRMLGVNYETKTQVTNLIKALDAASKA